MDERIGLYGGTFSPPHIGHYRAAETFLSQFSLDMLHIMPASVPPHKAVSPYDDPMHRYNMAVLAFEPLCRGHRAVVSTLELERTGKSYTADTLRELCRMYDITREHGIYMLTGTDMFCTLDRWREPEVVFSLAHIVYVSRTDGDGESCCSKAAQYREKYGAMVDRLDISPYEVSSTELRTAISLGEMTEGVIAPAVMDYIRKAGLYSGD